MLIFIIPSLGSWPLYTRLIRIREREREKRHWLLLIASTLAPLARVLHSVYILHNLSRASSTITIHGEKNQLHHAEIPYQSSQPVLSCFEINISIIHLVIFHTPSSLFSPHHASPRENSGVGVPSDRILTRNITIRLFNPCRKIVIIILGQVEQTNTLPSSSPFMPNHQNLLSFSTLLGVLRGRMR